MREVLFRGKRLDNGEWVEGDLRHGGYYLNDPDVYICVPFADTIINYPVDPETVGQFVGLIDMNGKKIFEGDILERCLNPLRKRNTKCYWAIKDIRKTKDLGLYTLSFEVVSNIHDNPELLEGEIENA